MKVTINWEQAQRYRGTSERGHETFFDTTVKGGGLDSAASPMETVLEAAGACTAMDVIQILRKKRKTIESFGIALEAERAEDYPHVFTKIKMDFHLVSPDATLHDLAQAIELSWEKYCSVSIMLLRSGCEMTWQAFAVNSLDSSETSGRTEAFFTSRVGR
jgi:putative redox protein